MKKNIDSYNLSSEDKTINKILFKIYIICILVFWLIYTFEKSSLISSNNYALHEIFSLFVSIGMFIIPIISVLLLYYCVKKLKNTYCCFRYLLLLTLSIVMLTGHLYFFIYESSILITTGYSSLEKREMNGDSTFIYVNNEENVIRLLCDYDVYNKVIVDDLLAYKITYKHSSFTPYKGKLISLLTNDIIDNRK